MLRRSNYIKPMSHFSLHKFGDNLPVTSIVAFSQAAMGFGLGLLLARHFGRGTRTRVAVAMMATGLTALTPLIGGIITHVKNRPTSSSRMRRQLESIRRSTGVAGNLHQF
jgi:hypothetical protein